MENEKEISWFKFQSNYGNIRTSKVGVTISKDGTLRFNKVTGERLNLKPTQSVLLAYVIKENWILIKRLSTPETGSRELRALKDRSAHTLAINQFLQHSRVNWGSKTMYEVDKQISTGFIVINLNKIVG
jgi:hypothetical protein